MEYEGGGGVGGIPGEGGGVGGGGSRGEAPRAGGCGGATRGATPGGSANVPDKQTPPRVAASMPDITGSLLKLKDKLPTYRPKTDKQKPQTSINNIPCKYTEFGECTRNPDNEHGCYHGIKKRIKTQDNDKDCVEPHYNSLYECCTYNGGNPIFNLVSHKFDMLENKRLKLKKQFEEMSVGGFQNVINYSLESKLKKIEKEIKNINYYINTISSVDDNKEELEHYKNVLKAKEEEHKELNKKIYNTNKNGSNKEDILKDYIKLLDMLILNREIYIEKLDDLIKRYTEAKNDAADSQLKNKLLLSERYNKKIKQFSQEKADVEIYLKRIKKEKESIDKLNVISTDYVYYIQLVLVAILFLFIGFFLRVYGSVIVDKILGGRRD